MQTLRSKSKGKPEPGLKDLVSGKPLPSLFMTETDFEAWADEDTRAEWVNGRVELMSPVNTDHDDLCIFLIRLLGDYIEHFDLGRLLGAEVAVRFETIPSRRLPDIKFISKSRLGIIRATHIEGPPDLLLEIISPDSVARDYREKYVEYEKAGVKEYWIVDPIAQKLEAHVLKGKSFTPVLLQNDVVRSRVLPGFFLNPAWLWKRPLPPVLKTLKEMGVR